MMKNIAISAENISKLYKLGKIGTGTLSHDLNRLWYKLRGKEDPYLKIGHVNNRSALEEENYVWSLKDINFDIEKGDIVGILGRNGAGKSTLFKLLSKVTKPTTGRFKINGRVASLLEVGTGFNPELTGRENIYLNGAILGMRRQEITRKLDEIIDFSGVGAYVDTPVKRYSSGMYVRLAFSVAAHLDSEILIVDEVLAVGDAEFQKKCLGRIGDISKGDGRTVLLVSHNIFNIKALCNKGIFLANGQSEFGITPIDNTINEYLKTGNLQSGLSWNGIININNHSLQLENVSIEFAADKEVKLFTNSMPLDIIFKYQILKPSSIKYRIIVSIYANDGTLLFSTGVFLESLSVGSFTTKIFIPPYLLNKGLYKLTARFDDSNKKSLLAETEFNQFEISDLVHHTYGIIQNNEPKGYLHIPLKYLTTNNSDFSINSKVEIPITRS